MDDEKQADGEIRSCTWHEYRDLDGVNVTSLKQMLRSPAHFLQATATPRAATDAMVVGTLTHTAVLEPDRLLRDYVQWDGKVRRGAEWEAFCATAVANGRTIVRPADMASAIAMQRAVHSHAVAAPLLRHGRPEIAMLWCDRETGIGCKGRVDWLTGGPTMPVIVGLKTTADASLRVFQRQAARLRYHLQWAYYHDGYETISGRPARMLEIVVETSPPYDVVVYEITEGTLREGRREYRALLARLRECTETDTWDGQAPTHIVPLDLPSWAVSEQECTLVIEGMEVAL